MKIEKESDTLLREYRRNAMHNTMERLTKRKGTTWDMIAPAFIELFERQGEIVKALEECTGKAHPPMTREAILKEIEEMIE